MIPIIIVYVFSNFQNTAKLILEVLNNKHRDCRIQITTIWIIANGWLSFLVMVRINSYVASLSRKLTANNLKSGHFLHDWRRYCWCYVYNMLWQSWLMRSPYQTFTFESEVKFNNLEFHYVNRYECRWWIEWNQFIFW